MTELENLWAQWREETKYKNFCYWLNGFFEARVDKVIPLTPWQVETIEKQLTLIMHKQMIMPNHPLPPHPDMSSRWTMPEK